MFLIRAMEQIFSFGERWNVPFNSFHLSPHENIHTIALINIHYLYTIQLGFALLNGAFSSVLYMKYLYHYTHKHSF